MLLTVTGGGLGTGTATTLLVVGVVVTATAALVGLAGQHRGESARERRVRGTPAAEGAGRRSARRLRTLGTVALVDVWALGLGALVVTGATATSQPLLVGLVYGVVGCATLGGAVLVLGSLLPRADGAGDPVVASGRQAGRPRAQAATGARPLASVPPPVAGGPGARSLSTSGARGLSGTRERAAVRTRRREERERRRSHERRQTVTAVESVLGRGPEPVPTPVPTPAAPRSAASSPGALAARTAVPGRRVPGGA